VITGKDWLLFGPFAGWSPKVLKAGKVTVFASVICRHWPGAGNDHPRAAAQESARRRIADAG
jgi:hypothetical protein